MPSSTTAASSVSSSRSSCSGSPNSLFRLPSDFSTRNRAASNAARISFVVVFPADPVTGRHAPPPARSNTLREILEREERVRNDEEPGADGLRILRHAILRHDARQRAGRESFGNVGVSVMTRSVYRDEELIVSHGARINRDTGQPCQWGDASVRRNSQRDSLLFNRPRLSVLKGLGFTGLVSPLVQRPLRIKSTFRSEGNDLYFHTKTHAKLRPEI